MHGAPDHGPGPPSSRKLQGRLFSPSDHRYNLLLRACAGHTSERTDPDATIRTCRVADRLDLGRVGVTPRASLLCTETARRPGTIRWADGRAWTWRISGFAQSEWGIDLGAFR